jgi:diguanylate cyclase (GGDEF)-like protein
MFDELSDGVVIAAGGPWRLVYANAAFCRMVDRTPAELHDQPIADVFRGDASPTLMEQFERVVSGEASSANSSQVLVSASGTTRAVELRLHRLVVEGEPLVGIVVLGCEADPKKEAAVAESRRDPLTGLADRTVLLTRMAALLGSERAADRQFAVLFIDLDNFKQVNDAHGHLVGDRVLGEVARRLAGCVRRCDQIVRFGGDEFVVLVERVSGWPEIQPVVERIHAALARPIALADGAATLSVSVGVAEASAKHRTPEDVLGEADRAMYARKRAGI